jgi:hypothetical protein
MSLLNSGDFTKEIFTDMEPYFISENVICLIVVKLNEIICVLKSPNCSSIQFKVAS